MKKRVGQLGMLLVAGAMVASLNACATTGGSQTNTVALQDIGCQFESKKVCEQALAKPVNYSSGITTGNQSYFQQNAPATVWEQVPIKAPGGSEVDVQCQVNTQDKTVVYAYAAPSGTVSESDRNWFKQSGWCRGDKETEPVPAPKAEE
jgi:type IV pilus biogenesis protein CpaD/CtpE